MDLTQEYLTKAMIKFKEQEIYKNVHIIRDFIAPNRESFLTTAYAKSYYKPTIKILNKARVFVKN
ncbi:hypothetical protein EC545_05300 [Helicobacter pylori]|nr:hypothetical protein EC545_05300 [Helicobacter pylori]RVZ75833.1 hypothetical protein EC593_06520 [Helicobacter pylori]